MRIRRRDFGATGAVRAVPVALLSWGGLLSALVGGVFGVPAAVQGQQQGGVDVAPEPEAGLAVQGQVVARGSGLPAVFVQVRLIPIEVEDDDPDPVEPPPDRRERASLETLTDSLGVFRWARVPSGPYRLEVSGLGYRSLEQEVRIRGAPPVEIRVELVPEALALDPVVVVAIRSPRLDAGGFYERRERGLGSFLDRDEIELRAPGRVSDLLRTFAGLQLQAGPTGQASQVTLRGGCRPDIVIDGVNLGPNTSPDDFLIPGDLEGIEVHRGPTGPAQFARGSCGMILFWTVDPAVRGGGQPFSLRRLLAGIGFFVFAILATR